MDMAAHEADRARELLREAGAPHPGGSLFGLAMAVVRMAGPDAEWEWCASRRRAEDENAVTVWASTERHLFVAEATFSEGELAPSASVGESVVTCRVYPWSALTQLWTVGAAKAWVDAIGDPKAPDGVGWIVEFGAGQPVQLPGTPAYRPSDPGHQMGRALREFTDGLLSRLGPG